MSVNREGRDPKCTGKVKLEKRRGRKPRKNEQTLDERITIAGKQFLSDKKLRALRRLNIRERQFLVEFLSNGGDRVKAAEKVGDPKDRKGAHCLAQGILKKEKVKDALQILFVKAGLGNQAITDLLSKGLKARIPLSFQGEIISKYPDWKTRHRYLDTLLKLGDKYPSQKLDLSASLKDLPPEKERKELLGNLRELIGKIGTVK